MNEPLHLTELNNFCEHNICVKESVRAKIKKLIAEDLMGMDKCLMEDRLSDTIITFEDDVTSLIVYFYDSEDKHITYIYALDSDTLCGSARCVEDKENVVYVDEIYVEKGVRRTGICTLFLEFIEVYNSNCEVIFSLASEHGHLLGINDEEQTSTDIVCHIAKRRKYDIKKDVAIAHHA